MDVVEDALAQGEVSSAQVFIERFAFAGAAARLDLPPASPAKEAGADTTPETVVIELDGRRQEVHYQPGETFLETARRAGLKAPFSCEAGSCATCMARLEDGTATDARQQRVDARRGRRGVGAHLPGDPDLAVGHRRVRAVTVAGPPVSASVTSHQSWETEG